MPVFNAEDTLAECLDSIFQQSLPDFEIIAVNDFSSDRSVEILQSYHDPRIRVVDNQKIQIFSKLCFHGQISKKLSYEIIWVPVNGAYSYLFVLSIAMHRFIFL